MLSRHLSFISYFLYSLFLFFFNDPATTEIYTLSLHDALPIWALRFRGGREALPARRRRRHAQQRTVACQPLRQDRKSTRLNSSHTVISYAVFCLKKKKKRNNHNGTNKSHERIQHKPRHQTGST